MADEHLNGRLQGEVEEESHPIETSPDTGNPSNEREIPKENTRSTMAILFVLGFFAILLMCFVYAIKVNADITELKDVLIGVIGSLSGTLGFIVGYYYKSTVEP